MFGFKRHDVMDYIYQQDVAHSNQIKDLERQINVQDTAQERVKELEAVIKILTKEKEENGLLIEHLQEDVKDLKMNNSTMVREIEKLRCQLNVQNGEVRKAKEENEKLGLQNKEISTKLAQREQRLKTIAENLERRAKQEQEEAKAREQAQAEQALAQQQAEQKRKEEAEREAERLAQQQAEQAMLQQEQQRVEYMEPQVVSQPVQQPVPQQVHQPVSQPIPQPVEDVNHVYTSEYPGQNDEIDLSSFLEQSFQPEIEYKLDMEDNPQMNIPGDIFVQNNFEQPQQQNVNNIPPEQSPVEHINMEDHLDIPLRQGSANERVFTKTVSEALEQLEQALSKL